MRKEMARKRFLQSWETVGTKQSKIRIWTACEIIARKVIIELSEGACDLVERNKMLLTNCWLETDLAVNEFSEVPEDWKANVDSEIEEHICLKDDTVMPKGWQPSSSLPAENMTKGWKVKFKFKQHNINAYFSSTANIDFDLEMRRLEREKLLEMKRRKELAWTERRREKKKEL